jgi:hypothetical protein
MDQFFAQFTGNFDPKKSYDNPIRAPSLCSRRLGKSAGFGPTCRSTRALLPA